MSKTETQPGGDLHLTALMARHSLNLVTGTDRAALLAYGRDVYAAGQAEAAPTAPAVGELSQAARDVLAERRRQVEAEGWTPEHDDGYRDGDLALAASSYACAAANFDDAARDFPWPQAWWKPSTPRRNLEKAGALIIAEIERLDRAAAQAAAKGAP